MRFPRLSIRKLFLYFLAVTTCLFLFALNLHERMLRHFKNIVQTTRLDTMGRDTPMEISGQLSSLSNASHREAPRIPSLRERPWYMKGGAVNPKPSTSPDKLLPSELPGRDRIPEQLMYIPAKAILPEKGRADHVHFKKILLWNGLWAGLRTGRRVFLNEKCPASTCTISESHADLKKADMVLFKDGFLKQNYSRPKDQLWVMYLLESPRFTQSFEGVDVFNWTATYRSDSTVVAPYERWQYFNENVKQLPLARNYATNKTKQVAWFVSNCNAKNRRLEYAKELAMHIQVDIYGSCGTQNCPRTNERECFRMMERDYKFYLAFENSNCKDYITEKFFVNGLGRDVIPIAMGARAEDYERSAPLKSYINVDDFQSAADLAKYLHELDRNDDLYNEYFRWKNTGEFINTKFFCRLCSLLHNPRVMEIRSHYSNLEEWWRGKDTCIDGSWREHKHKAVKKEWTAGDGNGKTMIPKE